MGEDVYLLEKAKYERDRRLRIKGMGKARIPSMKYDAVCKRIQRERATLKKREAELAAVERINVTDNNTATAAATSTAAVTVTVVPKKRKGKNTGASIISMTKVSHKITSYLGSYWQEKSVHKNATKSTTMTGSRIRRVASNHSIHNNSIQEIDISSKDANYLEYKPTNKKRKSPILKINNKNLKEPPIHPVTDTNNSDQSRPRHFTTPDMIKRLDPIYLDRTIGPCEYPVKLMIEKL